MLMQQLSGCSIQRTLDIEHNSSVTGVYSRQLAHLQLCERHQMANIVTPLISSRPKEDVAADIDQYEVRGANGVASYKRGLARRACPGLKQPSQFQMQLSVV